MFDCLKDIIGVTSSDCACLVAGLSDEIKEKLSASGSGNFMDQIPDALSLKALKGADVCKSFAELALDARDNALSILGNDVTIAISNQYKKAVRNYRGNVSKASYQQTLGNARRFQGLSITGNEHTDGEFKITRIRVVGNASGVMALKIRRTLLNENDFETVGDPLPFTASQNNFAAATLPSGGIILPLGKDLVPYVYQIYFDLNDLPEFRPKDTPIGCGCSGSDADLLKSFALIEGVSFSDESSTTFTMDGYSHGIILDVEINCKTESLLCREYASSEDISIACNFAAMYKANEILMEKILSSPEINRFTMQNRDYLWGKRNHFRKEYENRVLFIATRIDVSHSDCFACRPRSMWKGKVRS